MPARQQALNGIRVLDFTQVIFGPSCTAQLADHGAEVIKVERPGVGDLARQFGPFVDGESMPYASINRNKKSLALDLKAPAGLEVVYRLIDGVDVVVSNFRQGVMESLGLGWEEVHARNPRVIYASGSGYGPDGPIGSTRKMGHDSMAQAMTGIMAVNADSNGVPRRVRLPVADFSAGSLLMEGVLLALIERASSGVGQKVEVALIDALLWMQGWTVASVANAPEQEDHLGNPLDGGVYMAADGYIVVTGLFRPDPLRAICEVLGIEDLSLVDRFSTVGEMMENAEELHDIIQVEIEKHPGDHWVEKFDAVDVLCMPVMTIDRTIAQPQVIHNDMVVEVARGGSGESRGGGEAAHRKQRHVGVPVKLRSTPGSVRTAAPGIGEHSREVLAAAEYSEDKITELATAGVIGVG
ncbi:MAG: CaiB/BaiF CoA-transferase family protein [Dehalococcoidia bacterium]|jgi:formyl-CoA transferase|nr:CaiB/BaiF CoA-transferase family protein [Dehalococcoidia bacterium]